MYFRHPEFLYALFALIIPILIHLFQLRKFRKTDFTNVQLLKSVVIQTRKSSQLKKWLTLLARLLALASAIIAFAQPYVGFESPSDIKSETVIYLDNSFSMQAKGTKGPLLQRAVQEILSTVPEDERITLFTNTKTFRNVGKKDIQNDLLQLEYSANQLSYKAALLKSKKLLGDATDAHQRIVLISDFQQQDELLEISEDMELPVHLVQLKPISTQNVSIDSVSVDQTENNKLKLSVSIRNSGAALKNTAVSLYNEGVLVAKTSVNLPENGAAITSFQLEEDIQIRGRIALDDPNLRFDNTYYFSINRPKKIKVVSINSADDRFIKRIFTNDEFELIATSPDNLNYNDINAANLVILNEIEQIPLSLINALKSFHDIGGSICFIPSTGGNVSSYNEFFAGISVPLYNDKREDSKKITTINFSHPLYNGVFDKKVSNFQYPQVTSFFATVTGNPILSFENSDAFLYASGNNFIFTASINNKNSNFKNSPLIVPTFYKMGKNSLRLSRIYYKIGTVNSFEIPVILGEDGILTLQSQEETFIPKQQRLATKVAIITDQIPTKAGIYQVKEGENYIQDISYNYAASESNLQYFDLFATKYQVTNSVTDLFEQIEAETSTNELWKWFVIFALVFLIIEMLLLKYLP